jgi:hypothetical protein
MWWSRRAVGEIRKGKLAAARSGSSGSAALGQPALGVRSAQTDLPGTTKGRWNRPAPDPPSGPCTRAEAAPEVVATAAPPALLQALQWPVGLPDGPGQRLPHGGRHCIVDRTACKSTPFSSARILPAWGSAAGPRPTTVCRTPRQRTTDGRRLTTTRAAEQQWDARLPPA